MVDRPGLERFIRSHQRVGLDTSLLIYFIEGHPEFYGLSRTVFEAIESG